MYLFLFEAKGFYFAVSFLVENVMNTSKCAESFPRKTGSKILEYGEGGNVVSEAKILQRRGDK